MDRKHLGELLKEEQEPFVLKNYIDDRHCQLKRSVPKTHLQVKRRNPISENSSFPANFCRNACFFSIHDSPDVRKSPLFNLFSPTQSPCRNSNTISVHIFEAAMRIQKQSSSTNSKTPNKSLGFGLFGSILKRITLRKRNRKREIKRDGTTRVPVTDERREIPETVLDLESKSFSEMGFSCSCNSRLSSVWSESNEDKSLDLETSSSRSEDSDEMEFVIGETNTGDFSPREVGLCSSPFRFSLQKSPSPGGRTPEFQSPMKSPSLHKKEVKENDEEGEDKEQCSPVSVLDPPFKDDDVERQEDDADNEDGFEIERSFAVVLRAKQHLMQKLRRFERLAELDPVELEKRMTEQELGEEDDGERESDELLSSDAGNNDDSFVKEVLRRVEYLCHLHKIPADLKRLVLDLIAEERREGVANDDKEAVAKRVCRRLESWNEVELNTINMMVELDFSKEGFKWQKNHEQVQETAVEIELGIFGYLLEELSEELFCSVGI